MPRSYSDFLARFPERPRRPIAAIWARLDGSEPTQRAGYLSSDDRLRLSSYCRREDAELFLRSRTVLRSVLAGWMSCPVEEVVIEVTEHGKPRVVEGPQFSVSHSGAQMVVVLSERGAVGVDIEDTGFEGTHARLLQTLHVACQESTERSGAASMIWVRREAVVKADGRGLVAGLSRVRFERRPGAAHTLVARIEPDLDWRWLVQECIRHCSGRLFGAVALSLSAAAAQRSSASTLWHCDHD